MATQWLAGSYSADMGGTSLGIELMRTRANGALEAMGLAAEIQSPSFLAGGADRVYAAAEGAARVVSFRVDGTSLVADGSVESGGAAPCHLTVLPGAVVVANYLGGNLGVISLDDGAVTGLTQVVPGEGSGPRVQQGSPHLHSSLTLPDGTLLAADLGADALRRYRVSGSELTLFEVTTLPPGTGPRDLALHTSGVLWMLGELGGVIHAFEVSDGALVPLASVTLPGWVEGDQASALSFSGDGAFCYAGVRGSNRVSVLRVTEEGLPEAVTSVSCEGDWPRHLVVDGDVLHVVNQRSSSIASFRLGADGIPVLIDTPTPVATPTYLLAMAT